MEDIRTILKEHADEIEKRVKRHIDVLVEDFNSQVKLIGEQHNSIIERFDGHATMLAAVKEDTEIIKMDIEFIKNSLKKKVDLEEFEALERRVSLLEAKAHA